VLALDQAREALARVAGGHTRGKIVLHIGQAQPESQVSTGSI
jgi:hypothetical protein